MKYLLRSVTFQQNDSAGVVRCVNREPLNKPFVMISAMFFAVNWQLIDVSKFIYLEMGFADEYAFLKKASLLNTAGYGADTIEKQLYFFPDLTDFEIDERQIILQDITVATDFPIVHILEKIG